MMATVRAGVSLATGLALTDLSLNDLWLRYFELTGERSASALRDYLAGDSEWSAHEHDIAALALNEYLTEHGLDHPIRYAEDL